MTKEQILEFDRFLRIRDMYKIYYDTLKKCPIEPSLSSKDVYLHNVPAALVLSYGFYQTRMINNIKESDWVILRNEWIEYASNAGAIDSCFDGIHHSNIVSAINSVFNGKQYRGVLRTAEQVQEKIAEEAKKIQDEKNAQKVNLVIEDQKRLNEIIESCDLNEPDVLYNEDVLAKRKDRAARNFFSSPSSLETKKLLRRILNEVTSKIGTDDFQKILKSLNEFIDQLEIYQRKKNDVIAAEEEKFKEEKQSYVEKYKQAIMKKEEAIKQLKALEAPKEDTVDDKYCDENELIKINMKKKSVSRIYLGSMQIKVFPKSYRIGFSSDINSRIVENNYHRFDMAMQGGILCIRVNNSADSELYPRYYCSKTNICTTSKNVTDIICSHFGIDYSRAIIDVDMIETNRGILIRLLSAKSAEI